MPMFLEITLDTDDSNLVLGKFNTSCNFSAVEVAKISLQQKSENDIMMLKLKKNLSEW